MVLSEGHLALNKELVNNECVFVFAIIKGISKDNIIVLNLVCLLKEWEREWYSVGDVQKGSYIFLEKIVILYEH